MYKRQLLPWPRPSPCGAHAKTRQGRSLHAPLASRFAVSHIHRRTPTLLPPCSPGLAPRCVSHTDTHQRCSFHAPLASPVAMCHTGAQMRYLVWLRDSPLCKFPRKRTEKTGTRQCFPTAMLMGAPQHWGKVSGLFPDFRPPPFLSLGAGLSELRPDSRVDFKYINTTPERFSGLSRCLMREFTGRTS